MSNKQVIRLGDAATFINGMPFKPTDWDTKGLPIIRIQNLTGSSDEINYYSGEYDLRYEINDGDVLISWSASLGVYIWENGKAILNQHIFKVIFDKVEFDKIFFKYAVSHKLGEMALLTHGSTMKHITKGYFDNVEIPYPQLQEQKKIAEILDKASNLISLRKKQIEKLDLLVKAKFIEMFGDPIRNEKKWRIELIEDTVSSGKNALKAGPFGSSLKKEYYVDKGYKIYGQEQVISGDAHFGDYYIDEQKYKELENYSVQEGDVLISLVGTYGKLLIIPTDYEAGIINPRLMKITFNKQIVNTIFFKHFFASDSLKRYLTDNTHGGTMDILNLGIVRKIPLVLPPIELQNQFADFVQQVEKQKALLQQGLTKLELQYKSLMQQYFG